MNTLGRIRGVLVISRGRIFICTSNGNPNADDDKIIELNKVVFLELNHFNNRSFKLFPNPSNGVFTLEFVTILDKEYNLEILSINGSLVLKQEIHNSSTQINAESLSPGLYFMKVSNSNRAIYKKIIIK